VIRVLHIDDEAVIRLLCRVNLEPEGMEVIEAADGWTGVELAKREKPDLILLGVNLPGGTAPRVNLPPGTKPWFDATKPIGFQVAEELRNDQGTHEIPIVFLTAGASSRSAHAGSTSAPSTTSPSPSTPRSWPHASAGCSNGSSAASGTSCGATRSPTCARA
jgi:CheY-like chemotaxis protein